MGEDRASRNYLETFDFMSIWQVFLDYLMSLFHSTLKHLSTGQNGTIIDPILVC